MAVQTKVGVSTRHLRSAMTAMSFTRQTMTEADETIYARHR
jgi:hypothetical protein